MLIRKISSFLVFAAFSATVFGSTVNVFNMTPERINVTINNGFPVKIVPGLSAPVTFSGGHERGNLTFGDNSVEILPATQRLSATATKSVILHIHRNFSDSAEPLHMVIIKNANNEYIIPPLY